MTVGDGIVVHICEMISIHRRSNDLNKNKLRYYRTNSLISLGSKLQSLNIYIKQFMVTNCTKERPGSIVAKTLNNGILILIVTSKESYFNVDFKYINFIKFSSTHQKL